MHYPTIGQIVREDPALDELLAPDARIEQLADGLVWSEGPVWIWDGDYLLFSDIPRNAILKWKEGEGLSVFMQPSGYTGVAWYGLEPGSNALTLDSQGRLTMCEHGDRRISRLEPRGGKKTLADSYQGRRLNSPNDLVYKSGGSIYFTDPAYGLPGRYEDRENRELDFCGVFRVSPEGEVTLLTDELKYPNGLAFSPGESILYVGQSGSERAIWMVYPVLADGTLGKGEVFQDVTSYIGKLPGAPDGFKVDRHGNIWATGPGGVWIFSPGGRVLGRLDTGQRTANCAWGGPDGSTLYICAHMYLCRIETRTRGAVLPGRPG
jgi:gluconolactonase